MMMYMWVYGMIWIYFGVYGLYVLDNAPGRCAELPPRAWPPVVVEKSGGRVSLITDIQKNKLFAHWPGRHRSCALNTLVKSE